MREVAFSDMWPESWKVGYRYDRLEVFGELTCRGHTYAYENRFRQTLDIVKRVAPPGSRILDVAAAQGNFSLALAEAGYRVTWNDMREELAEYVKLKLEHGDVTFAPGNVFDLSFEEQFDVVLITEVIEHVAYPDRFLAKVATFVRPGGHIAMSTPNGEYVRFNSPKFSDCADPSLYERAQFAPDSDGHIFLLHADELAWLAVAAGVETREVRLINNVLTSGHVKSEFALRLLPRAAVDALESMTASLPLALKRKLNASFVVLFSKPARDGAMEPRSLSSAASATHR